MITEKSYKVITDYLVDKYQTTHGIIVNSIISNSANYMDEERKDEVEEVAEEATEESEE